MGIDKKTNIEGEDKAWEEFRQVAETSAPSIEDLLTIIAEQARLQSGARDATRNVLAVSNPEKQRTISFRHAARRLQIYGNFDLEAARREAVHAHQRWGLVDALINAGLVRNSDHYGALFDNAQIQRADVEKAVESLARGKKILPLFDAGLMDLDKLFSVLFTESGIPYHDNSYGYQNLSKVQRVVPDNIPDLDTLHNFSPKDQQEAFQAGYKFSDPLEPLGARIVFAPDTLEVTQVRTSATQDMQALARGDIEIQDPFADLIRFRTQVDNGLRELALGRLDFDGLSDLEYKSFLHQAFRNHTVDRYLPDRKRTTRYSNFVFVNGGVLGLDCYEHDRKLLVGDYAPDTSFGTLGTRIPLGKSPIDFA